MEFLVFGLIVLCGLMIFYCWVSIYLEREAFVKKISVLEEQFEQQSQKQFVYEIQEERLKITVKKQQKLNAFLNEAIFDLNANLFAELFLKKNL